MIKANNIGITIACPYIKYKKHNKYLQKDLGYFSIERYFKSSVNIFQLLPFSISSDFNSRTTIL